jgi:hypothetical protein
VSGAAPVFLLGAQRSGTTALASALNAAFAREGRVFTVNGKLPYVLDRWITDADIAGRHLRSDEIIHALRRKPPYGQGALPWLESACAAVAAAARDVADGRGQGKQPLIRRIGCEAYGSSAGWGDKYNEYLLDVGCLRPFLASARLLVLIRDPVDVAASMLNWTPQRDWVPATVEAAQDKWLAWHGQFLDRMTGVDVPTMFLEYEQMWHPKCLERIGQFCGLAAAPEAVDAPARTKAATPGERTAAADAMWRSLRSLVDSC